MTLSSRALTIGLAAALAWSGGSATNALRAQTLPRAGERPSSSSGITGALAARIEGKAQLGDVRIDVFWSQGGKATTARVFGDGVGVWQRGTQFRLSRSEVLAILAALQKAGFGSMPDRFGEEEGAEGNEGPRLKGRLVVQAGADSKSILQLVDGEQSRPFARLVKTILEICRGPARRGVDAPSMSDALGMLAAEKLSPQLLEVAVQRRPGPKATGQSQDGWTLTISGLRASAQRIGPDGPQAPRRTLMLSKKDFHELAALLSVAGPSALPQSLYAASYIDVTVAILKFSRTVAGRRFLGMTPETHGKKQKDFDRITTALEALHARVEREGAP